MVLTDQDQEQLCRARRLLESPSIAVRLTDLMGRPIAMSIGALPVKAQVTIQTVVKSSLDRALSVAFATMGKSTGSILKASSDRLHKLAGATAGAVGGAFGLPGLAVELPITTTIMLRSIGDIARAEGHDLARPETRLACLEVFALGGSSPADDTADTGYYAVRATLAGLVSDAVSHAAGRGLARHGTPVLVRLVEKIAARFGLVVQEKVALEMVPVIGAVGGALVNSLFMSHFQDAARGHFIVKRLEGVYGREAVKRAYSEVDLG